MKSVLLPILLLAAMASAKPSYLATEEPARYVLICSLNKLSYDYETSVEVLAPQLV